MYFTSTGVSIWNGANPGDITGVTAGTGISGGGTSGTVTLAIDTAVTVDKTTAQTLTNKTLTTPIISSISNTGTLTLPTSTDTLVGRATTDTLTNKTLTSPALTTPTISTLTTSGDLLYGTGSGALTRLGIGSSSQVLTVASGVPSWATPTSGSTYSGASIYRSADLTLSATSSTTFTWDSESWDTDGYHSTSSNTDRFTIPTGKSGKFLLMCNASVSTQTAGLEGYFMKNGTDIRRMDITTSPVKTLIAHTVLDLVATDYVIFRIYNSSASTANCTTGSGNQTQWSITYLGA